MMLEGLTQATVNIRLSHLLSSLINLFTFLSNTITPYQTCSYTVSNHYIVVALFHHINTKITAPPNIGNALTMPAQTAYIERDGRGRERLVIPKRSRSQSHHRKSDRELLNESEEIEVSLGVELAAMQNRLSMAQRDQWEYQNLREQHQRLIHEHQNCRNLHAQLDAQVREVRRIEDLLADEEDKSERLHHRVQELKDKVEELKEKIRLMRRTSGEFEVYRARYEEKAVEVEVLRRSLAERDRRIIEQDEHIRLADIRVQEKNSTILYLKNYLTRHGFRVDG